MEKSDIIKMVDHTLLSRDAGEESLKEICAEAVEYNAASVCIPPCYVKRCKDTVGDKINVCTVIGFPNGYNTAKVKAYETRLALEDGADEIDMVINLTDVKDKRFSKIEDEIRLIKSVCGDKILKVIVEACMLNEEEKIKLCRIVSSSGADFIKTSTGFASGGAEVSDIALFKKYIEGNVKIKAAGGISSFEQAERLIAAGADRLGSSRLIKLMKG